MGDFVIHTRGGFLLSWQLPTGADRSGLTLSWTTKGRPKSSTRPHNLGRWLRSWSAKSPFWSRILQVIGESCFLHVACFSWASKVLWHLWCKNSNYYKCNISTWRHILSMVSWHKSDTTLHPPYMQIHFSTTSLSLTWVVYITKLTQVRDRLVVLWEWCDVSP